MNPAYKPEDIENMVMYERSGERRSGADRRNRGSMKNKDLRKEAEKSELTKPASDNTFIGDFGWPDLQQ